MARKYLKKYRNTNEKLMNTNLYVEKDTVKWFKDRYGIFWTVMARRVLRSFMVAEKSQENDREIFR